MRYIAAGVGFCVRPFAAEEVAERQVDEDQPDDARPDEVARAEDVADQAPGGEFGGEGGHAGDEDSEEDVAFHMDGDYTCGIEFGIRKFHFRRLRGCSRSRTSGFFVNFCAAVSTEAVRRRR
ncbi:MAG: hypothetical protein MZV63_06845 [Marinilabiliales bacterium]|nr:hypothetical protein [Marinilabiliales bacterium]